MREMTPELQKVARIYASFMEETKIRLNEIGRIVERFRVTQDKETPRAFLDAEFAFLQLRYVCELVALAALAAHKPLGLNRELMNCWSAGKTFTKLARMNPLCFPRLANVTSEGRQHHVHHVDDGLKRKELQDIWNDCGEILHRGVLGHVFNDTQRVYDIQKLDKWAAQIGALLSSHVIMVLERQFFFYVTLSGGEGGDVQILTIATDGPVRYAPPSEPGTISA